MWDRVYGSKADFDAGITISERIQLTEVEQWNKRKGPKGARPEPVILAPVPQKQFDVAVEAARFILSKSVIPGEVTVRLNGHDGPENQTDSVSVTISQR